MQLKSTVRSRGAEPLLMMFSLGAWVYSMEPVRRHTASRGVPAVLPVRGSGRPECAAHLQYCPYGGRVGPTAITYRAFSWSGGTARTEFTLGFPLEQGDTLGKLWRC